MTLVTPESLVSAFTVNTLEQAAIQRRLLELERHAHDRKTAGRAAERDGAEARLRLHGTAGARSRRRASCSSPRNRPTTRSTTSSPRSPTTLRRAGIRKVVRIGDCLAPGTIAAAVYSGHRFARELDVIADAVPSGARTWSWRNSGASIA